MGNYTLLKFALISLFAFFLFLVFPKNTYAQSCVAPGQPGNVTIDYPNCSGQDCNFEQAMCSWEAASNATSYQVTVTQVESGQAVVTNQSVSGTSYTFPVVGNKTYKCDVTGLNSCGQAGSTGTFSLLCATDLGETSTPTAPPVVVPPKSIPPTGSMDLILISVIGLIAVLSGGVLISGYGK